MSYTDYKTGPIFSKTERKLIDAYGGVPQGVFAESVNDEGSLSTNPQPDNPREELLEGVSEKDVKSRLRNGRASTQRASSLFAEFTDDLHRLENYYRSVEGNPIEFHFLCQELEQEMKRMEMLLESWKEYAEIGSQPPEALSSAFEPLREGTVPFETQADYEEFDTRMGTLLWILQHQNNEQVVQLLRGISEMSWRAQMNELSDLSVGKKNGIEYTGQELGGKKGMVKQHDRSSTNNKAFVLTDRGEAVLRTIDLICELDQVSRKAESEDIPIVEAAKEVVLKHTSER